MEDEVNVTRHDGYIHVENQFANPDETPVDESDWLMIGMDIVLVVSILINALLLIAVLTSRKLLRETVTALVISIATCDMLQLIFYRIILEVIWRYEAEPAGDHACKAGAFFDAMFNAASVFSLIAIAYERYLAICHPLQLQRRRGTAIRQGVLRSVACWIVAFLYAIPQLWMNRMVVVTGLEQQNNNNNNNNSTDILHEHVDHDTLLTSNNDFFSENDTQHEQPIRSCDLFAPDGWHWLGSSQPAINFLLFYILPTALIGFFFGTAASTLFRASKRFRSLEQGDRDAGRLMSETRENHKIEKWEHAAISMIALIVINVLVMFPMNMTLLIYDYELIDRNELHVFAYVALYSYFINCAVNAVMICILSNQIRRQVFYVIMFIVLCGRKRRIEQFIPMSHDNYPSQQCTMQTDNLRGGEVNMDTFATNRPLSTDEP